MAFQEKGSSRIVSSTQDLMVVHTFHHSLSYRVILSLKMSTMKRTGATLQNLANSAHPLILVPRDRLHKQVQFLILTCTAGGNKQQ